MPWIYNPTRDVHPTKLQDGSSYGFLPRKRVYIQPSQMSAEAWRLVQAGMLVNQGGDPLVVDVQPVQVIQANLDPVEAIRPSESDTSSVHHESSARVAIDSSSAPDGEKESKAVKKQDDDFEKATSVKPEADPDLKNDTKTEKRGSRSRKR